MDQRANRIGSIIAGVLHQALEDSGARRVVLLGDGTPEAGLLASLLGPRLGSRFGTESVAGPAWPDLLEGWARVEREQPGALVAIAANKTAALLGGALPGPVVPLGDLWASQVRTLCGSWSGPRALNDLCERAGGIEAVDGALGLLVDRRRTPREAAAALPGDAGGTLLALWERGRFVRRRLGLVPKLGARTIGVDLFD